ncbi:sip1/TFIP11 interacting protein [Asbolus verrucosus]|uniref:Sip1/TFIP11 interacting protein n=1 Tax=Asbolus verrucosus TaxID=1661398 RepID=A0A482VDV3_ASBVE|nr:sip1/TFIP11 interacting protein [Asbolus verrucosus]
MSDDEMEKFEITDYDLNNEFYRGIWADDSDNEADERPSFKSRKPKSYTAPIGFVAGGVQQAGKNNDKAVTKKEESGSDDERPTTSFKSKNSSSESDEELPRPGFGGAQSTVTEITGDIAGLRNKTNKSGSNLKGMGNWERHTKGIGAKLLLQMGFQPGRGLGKDLQGISAPVEAHQRKGRGAIGAYGPEKPATIPKKKDIKEEIEEEDKNDHKWKKSDMAQKKTRYYYRSVDDVIEKGKRPGAFRGLGAASELSKVKVIDMTGPQQRVLSGYHALSGLKAPPGVEHFEDVVHKKCSNFTLPEIQHNLDILVDMCEQDIIRIDRNTRHNQDRIVGLKQEQEALKNLVQKEDELIDNLRNVIDIVDKLLNPSLGLSLLQVAQIFNNLQSNSKSIFQENHYEEFVRYELGELAPGLVGPLLTSALASWSPLTNPKQYMDVFDRWKDILDKPRQRGTLEGNNMGIQPYDSLLWHTWMPVMRICVSTWNPKDCDPMINLIETWMPSLPQWILDNIYDQLIMPRIQAEVNVWNPLTDTIPIHVWIHPWIPLLDTRLQAIIYPIIQEKLGAALTNWHPSDKSAKPMLKPWQRVLPDGVFVAFLIKHIVPKLQICMQNLVINPHQQHLDAWYWVMDWSDMLSVGNMTLILDKFFFPRWRQTLAMWLNHNPNYAEVTDWYTGWKNMLSEELLAQPTIKENFHNALEIMNRAVNIGQQPGAKESISYLTSMENNAPPPPPPPRVESFVETVRSVSKIPPLYKDLVAKRCEERGILFVPIPNKYYEAKQVYRIGTNGLQCYIDRNVVFSSHNNSNWIPTSLNRLLDMA